MSKKAAIIITVVVVVAVYTFLLVVMPILINMVADSSIVELGVPSRTSKFMYFLPGAIGVIIIGFIMRQAKEKEVKDG